jgi:hypothetical protein
LVRNKSRNLQFKDRTESEDKRKIKELTEEKVRGQAKEG